MNQEQIHNATTEDLDLFLEAYENVKLHSSPDKAVEIIKTKTEVLSSISYDDIVDQTRPLNQTESMMFALISNKQREKVDRDNQTIIVVLGWIFKFMTLFSQGFMYRVNCRNSSVTIISLGLSGLSLWQVISAKYEVMNDYWGIPIVLFVWLVFSRLNFLEIKCKSSLYNYTFPFHSMDYKTIWIIDQPSLAVNNYDLPNTCRIEGINIYKDRNVFCLNRRARIALDDGDLPLELFLGERMLAHKHECIFGTVIKTVDSISGLNECVSLLDLSFRSILKRFHIRVYDFKNSYNHVSDKPFPGSIEVSFFKFCELYCHYRFYKKDLSTYEPNKNTNDPLPPLDYESRIATVCEWVDSLKNSENMKRRLKNYLIECICQYHQVPCKKYRTSLEYRIRWRNHMLWALNSDKLDMSVVSSLVEPEYSDLAEGTLFGGKYGDTEEQIEEKINTVLDTFGEDTNNYLSCSTKKWVKVQHRSKSKITVAHSTNGYHTILPTYKDKDRTRHQFKNIERPCNVCDGTHLFDVELNVRQAYSSDIKKRPKDPAYVCFNLVRIEEEVESVRTEHEEQRVAPINWFCGQFKVITDKAKDRKGRRIPNKNFPRKLSPFFKDNEIKNFDKFKQKKQDKNKNSNNKKIQKEYSTKRKMLFINKEIMNKNSSKAVKTVKVVTAREALNSLVKKYSTNENKKKKIKEVDWAKVIINVQKKIEYCTRKGIKNEKNICIDGLFPSKAARLAFKCFPLIVL